MPDYTVTGTVTPDCTGDYTDAGEYNGQRYYTCTNDAGTWYMLYRADTRWYIVLDSNGDGQITTADLLLPHFVTEAGSTNPAQNYKAQAGASGTAVAAEYVSPTVNPRLSGVLSLVISHVNGLELNPAKRFELEFDS